MDARLEFVCGYLAGMTMVAAVMLAHHALRKQTADKRRDRADDNAYEQVIEALDAPAEGILVNGAAPLEGEAGDKHFEAVRPADNAPGELRPDQLRRENGILPDEGNWPAGTAGAAENTAILPIHAGDSSKDRPGHASGRN